MGNKIVVDEMQKVTIVVPTYWTWSTDSINKNVDSIFDHPTPLNLDGALSRTLKSFKKLKYPNYDILVIISATNMEIADRAEKKVLGIIDQFKDELNIIHFSCSELGVFKERLFEYGHQKILEEINLKNYSNIRNLQLILSYVNGSDIVVAIDDDEIIDDSEFLSKAVEYVGKVYKGDLVAGVAGYYVDKEGNHRLLVAGQEKFENLFDKKRYLMDLTYNMLDNREGRLVKTPVVFGGNMVFSRSIIERISFDPYNTRGEDIDYLINALMEGLHFYLDKELNIIHLPPDYDSGHQGFNLSKLKQDILRFIYEKEKMQQVKDDADLKNIDIDELMPYPGSFFDDKVMIDAEEKLSKALSTSDIKREPVREAKEFVRFANERAKIMVPKYFEFRLLWKEMIKDIKDNQKLRDELLSIFCRKGSF